MKYSLFLFFLLIGSYKSFAQNLDKSDVKKGIIILMDDCKVEMPEEILEDYVVVDSTYNERCSIRTMTLYWNGELTGGSYYMRILPNLIFIGLVHDSPNPNAFYGVIKISEHQFSIISSFLQSGKYKNFEKISGLENRNILSLTVRDEFLFGKYKLPKDFDERLEYLAKNRYTLLKNNIMDILNELNKSFKTEEEKVDTKAVESMDFEKTKKRLIYTPSRHSSEKKE